MILRTLRLRGVDRAGRPVDARPVSERFCDRQVHVALLLADPGPQVRIDSLGFAWVDADATDHVPPDGADARRPSDVVAVIVFRPERFQAKVTKDDAPRDCEVRRHEFMWHELRAYLYRRCREQRRGHLWKHGRQRPPPTLLGVDLGIVSPGWLADLVLLDGNDVRRPQPRARGLVRASSGTSGEARVVTNGPVALDAFGV